MVGSCASGRLEVSVRFCASRERAGLPVDERWTCQVDPRRRSEMRATPVMRTVLRDGADIPCVAYEKALTVWCETTTWAKGERENEGVSERRE
jgi:hypothetical protein